MLAEDRESSDSPPGGQTIGTVSPRGAVGRGFRAWIGRSQRIWAKLGSLLQGGCPDLRAATGIDPPEGETIQDDPWGLRMAAAQTGDEDAYRRLLSDIETWLLAYYERYLPSASVAPAVRETLRAVHAKRHTYRMSRPFKPWLAEIARYKLAARLNRAGRETQDMFEMRTLPADVDLTQPSGAIVKLGRRSRRKSVKISGSKRQAY
jgi:hypothetical protein